MLNYGLSLCSPLCQQEDSYFVACVLHWLDANENVNVKASTLAALVRAAVLHALIVDRTRDNEADLTGLEPLFPPPVTPLVPHGPPAAGLGPRLCAA